MVPEVKPKQRDVVAPGLHRVESHGLAQRDAVELGVVIGGAVEADHLLEEFAGLGAGDQLVHQPGVAQRQRDLGLVDDLAELAGAQHRHGVDDDGAGLGRRQPARDQRRIVGRADQDAVARLDSEILDQRVGDAIGPVGKLFVGAAAAVADQRDVVAEAARHHAVGQFDAGVEFLGIVEAVERNLRPLLRRRQVVAREGVGVRRAAKRLQSHGHAPESVCRAMTTFWTSDAPS